MTTATGDRVYTIKEAAALTGLPASTLRYYESMGVITHVSRGATSGHRMYRDEDLDRLMWVACLAATGMSINDMRRYVENGELGRERATEQIALLSEQARRLEIEAQELALRTRYVDLKVAYWQAIERGDNEGAEKLGHDAYVLAEELRHITK